MAYDARFGPAAQAPAHRVGVLAQLQAALPCLKINAAPSARQLDARYVASELRCWAGAGSLTPSNGSKAENEGS